MQQNEITLKIKSSNPVDFKAKKEALEIIALQTPDVLGKIKKLLSSNKGIELLNNNWTMIEQMTK